MFIYNLLIDIKVISDILLLQLTIDYYSNKIRQGHKDKECTQVNIMEDTQSRQTPKVTLRSIR